MKAALACAAGLAGCAGNGPHLDEVEPGAARANEAVTVHGDHLCGDGACVDAAGAVTLGIQPPFVRLAVTSYADRAITLVVPSIAPVGTTQIVVTVNDTASNALAFEVLR